MITNSDYEDLRDSLTDSLDRAIKDRPELVEPAYAHLGGKGILDTIPPFVFQAVVDGLRNLRFVQVNDNNQLVLGEGCEEAYGLGETLKQARERQNGIFYLDSNAKIVKTGNDTDVLPEPPKSAILAVRGLPTLDYSKVLCRHIGEYAIMSGERESARGHADGAMQFDRNTFSWTECIPYDPQRGRMASWYPFTRAVGSHVADDHYVTKTLGSRAVVRITLDPRGERLQRILRDYGYKI